jgi:hypothetical protein
LRSAADRHPSISVIERIQEIRSMSKAQNNSGTTSSCLRPKADESSQAAFWPLFEQRNAVMEEQGQVTEAMFAAARRGDSAAHEQHKNRLEQLQLEEQRLSREMRAHQQ